MQGEAAEWREPEAQWTQQLRVDGQHGENTGVYTSRALFDALKLAITSDFGLIIKFLPVPFCEYLVYHSKDYGTVLELDGYS